MILDGDTAGLGRQWAEGLMSVQAYVALQFWAAVLVFAACIPQLHLGRKFRWPPEPGRLTILGYCIGLHLRSPWLSLRLGDLGTAADFVATLIGRAGIALQSAAALFALDDALSAPSAPRPLITFMLIAVAMIQVRSLTAYTPRLPPSLP